MSLPDYGGDGDRTVEVTGRVRWAEETTEPEVEVLTVDGWPATRQEKRRASDAWGALVSESERHDVDTEAA